MSDRIANWVADDSLGPIMRKKVEKAIRDLSWEGKTFYTAHRGFLGDPVDPDDLRFATTSIFLGREEGPLRTDDDDRLIREEFSYVLTKKNYKDVVTAYEEATASAVKDRPIKDERRTRLESEDIDVMMAERKAKDDARREELDRVKNELMTLAPAGATRVIVAELKEDASDPMSDYSSNRTVRSVAIGFSTKSREDFGLLHRCAAAFSETACYYTESGDKMEERRDNYSMGQGNYLSDHGWDGGGSGWVVRSRDIGGGYWNVEEIDSVLRGDRVDA